jgi:FkbH-like protein
VIWDLDETFWHGALADGDVEVDVRQRQRLIDLARRGVVSSICCKNEPGAARKRLQDEQVWAYFVFASISRAEKGQQVRNLLKRMRVPAESALFVDDSALERQEVARANPGISCLSPESWADLDVRHWGRDDPGLTRLGSYKLLESSQDESAEFRGSNLEFLRQSELVATLTQLTPEDRELDSVVELVRRSHLLNFTRTRLKSGRAELVQYLADCARVSFKVHARDRYEEHGLCGLVSISRSGELEHFAFSCRVLELGIEQAVFRWLGRAFPDLCVRFEVPLELEGPSDWVTLVGALGSSEGRADLTENLPAPPSDAALTLARRPSAKSVWAARLWSLARATRVRRLFRAEALATYLSRRFETLLTEMQ